MNTTLPLRSTATMPAIKVRTRVAALVARLRPRARSREELADLFALRREAERLRDETRRAAHLARAF